MVKQLAQGIAILVSILLAFWIDAWWQEQKEQEQEKETLQALAQSLEHMRVNLDWSERYNQSISVATIELMQLCNSAVEKLDTETVDELLSTTSFYNGGGDLGGSLLMKAIGGPALADLENPNLRFKLTKLAAAVDEATVYLSQDQQFVAEQLDPYYRQHTNMFQLDDTRQHMPGHPDDAWVHPQVPTGDYIDHRDLLCEREFRNLLLQRHQRLMDIMQIGFPALREVLAEVESALEETSS